METLSDEIIEVEMKERWNQLEEENRL